MKNENLNSITYIIYIIIEMNKIKNEIDIYVFLFKKLFYVCVFF